jgi:hypothetical protein
MKNTARIHRKCGTTSALSQRQNTARAAFLAEPVAAQRQTKTTIAAPNGKLTIPIGMSRSSDASVELEDAVNQSNALLHLLATFYDNQVQNGFLEEEYANGISAGIEGLVSTTQKRLTAAFEAI